MKKYIIADTHFNHKNIIDYCNRPFNDIDEMECEIINRWNNKVNSNDDVYILGDVFYRYKKDRADFLKKLNGRLHLIIGNHDFEILKNEAALACFESTEKLKQIVDNGRRVVMCHYPMVSWNMKHFGSYHVYGHVHSKVNEVTLFMIKQELAFNAGCMINNYEPCTLEELEENNQTFLKRILEENNIRI